MASLSPLKLPTINFSELGLKTGTPQWNLIRSQVKQALEEYGCFEALFEKVPKDLRKAVFTFLKELFDLPLQTKLKNFSKNPLHGYVGQNPRAPLYESMGIDGANNHEKAKAFTEIFWPEGNPIFCDTMESFSVQLSELDLIVRKMILEILGVEKYFDEHKESTNYLLRVMKYKGSQTDDKMIGLGAHTDKNLITILYQNQIEGLEVQTKAGDWISFNPQGDSFVVMIGDSLNAWTNGRFHSAKHRVMMRGSEARYSLGLFSETKAGHLIKAPEELVDEEHPLLFNPFDYYEFLKYYYTEVRQKAESALESAALESALDSALETYCGV